MTREGIARKAREERQAELDAMPEWDRLLASCSDRRTIDALLAFRAALVAVRDVTNTQLQDLPEAVQMRAIKTAGYIAWRSIGQEPDLRGVRKI